MQLKIHWNDFFISFIKFFSIIKIIIFFTIMLSILFLSCHIGSGNGYKLQKIYAKEPIWYTLYKRGISNYKAGLYKEAKFDLMRVIKYRSDLPYVYKYLGLINFKEHNYSRAVINFQRSLKFKKDQLDVLMKLGEIYSIQYSLRKAERIYLQILQIQANHSAAMLELIKLYNIENKPEKAKKYMETFTKLYGKQSIANEKKAAQALKNKKYQTAYSLLWKDINRNPVYENNFFLLARIYRIHDKKELTQWAYERVLLIYPQHKAATLALANFHFENGTLLQAKKYFIRVAAIDPNDKHNWIRVMDILKLLQMHKERYKMIHKARKSGITLPFSP